jgi:DNA-binding LacI/PurR family transcriptional regulator
MTTILKIASELGVSTATVSRALNDKPGVGEETRQRILRLASEMKYSPNHAARSLISATTRTAGFLFCDHTLPLLEDPFYLQVMRGAEQELSRQGYFLLISTLHGASPPTAGLTLLREKRADGLILAGPFFPQRFVLSLATLGIPLVLVDNSLQQTALNCILIDDENGSYAATRHLLGHGHKKIAMLSGPQDWVSIRGRMTGYRRAMAEASLSARIVTMNEATPSTGYQALRTALSEDPKISAIFAANDAMAFGAIQAARELGRAVPADLAIAGFDDVEAASHIQPTLTTLRVPKRMLGIQAARRLVELFDNKGEPPVTSTVTVELVVRSSCGCRETITREQ